jgi:hypothetical protein
MASQMKYHLANLPWNNSATDVMHVALLDNAISKLDTPVKIIIIIIIKTHFIFPIDI